jgi:hypothetical protein
MQVVALDTGQQDLSTVSSHLCPDLFQLVNGGEQENGMPVTLIEEPVNVLGSLDTHLLDHQADNHVNSHVSNHVNSHAKIHVDSQVSSHVDGPVNMDTVCLTPPNTGPSQPSASAFLEDKVHRIFRVAFCGQTRYGIGFELSFDDDKMFPFILRYNNIL